MLVNLIFRIFLIRSPQLLSNYRFVFFELLKMNVGSLGPVHKVLFACLADKGEHVQLFEVMKQPQVIEKMSTIGDLSDLQVVEYQRQVVAGFRYRVVLEHISKNLKYEMNIWQKPYNSVLSQMPPPEVISLTQLEHLDF